MDEKWTTKILWTDTQCKWPMGNSKDNSTVKWDTHIPEMIKAANTILNHIDGILLHIKTNITNGKIEGMNSKLRGFTKRAFGFKTSKNLKITIFIALGKLNLTPA